MSKDTIIGFMYLKPIFFSEKGKNLDEPYDSEGATILHYAAAHGYLDLTRFLLSKGVQVNNQDKEGWTPLHAATCWMQPEVN